jgi:hypothetical protein
MEPIVVAKDEGRWHFGQTGRTGSPLKEENERVLYSNMPSL